MEIFSMCRFTSLNLETIGTVVLVDINSVTSLHKTDDESGWKGRSSWQSRGDFYYKKQIVIRESKVV